MSKYQIIEPGKIGNFVKSEADTIGGLSDGYHTFDELYEHRITLFIALCRTRHVLGTKGVWRSKVHSDGSTWDGWFLMCIGMTPGEQISYHLPMDRWEETKFAHTFEKAPDFDGHTPTDVLDRLKSL